MRRRRAGRDGRHGRLRRRHRHDDRHHRPHRRRTRPHRPVYVPAGLRTDRPVPLLVALHAGTGWGRQFERTSGYDAVGDEHGFIVTYPDGIGIGPRGDLLRA